MAERGAPGVRSPAPTGPEQRLQLDPLGPPQVMTRPPFGLRYSPVTKPDSSLAR